MCSFQSRQEDLGSIVSDRPTATNWSKKLLIKPLKQVVFISACGQFIPVNYMLYVFSFVRPQSTAKQLLSDLKKEEKIFPFYSFCTINLGFVIGFCCLKISWCWSFFIFYLTLVLIFIYCLMHFSGNLVTNEHLAECNIILPPSFESLQSLVSLKSLNNRVFLHMFV